MPANPITAEPLRLLVLASRPSDYTEMSELARALAARGHRPSLIYFYAPTDPGSEAIIRNLQILAQTPGVSAQAVDIDDVQRGQARHGDAPMAGAQPSQAAEVGLYRLVLALRDRVLGRRMALALRRHLPTVRRIFPVVYKIARLVDVIRNLPAGIRMAWGAVNQGLAFSRAWPLHVRILVLFKGPKVMADAAFMEHVYRRFLAFFQETLASTRTDALLIPEDIVGNLWPVAIKAGHEAGVPTVVFPYTLANKEEAFQSLKDQPSYQTDRNQIAVMLYPRWRLVERGADLVRLPSAHIFAHERLGIAPPDPWMMNSGFADAIGVDSKASYDYFLAGGIPAEQMRIVGSVSQDQMFDRRQKRAAHLDTLRSELKLSGSKPVLLVSGCPNQLAAAVPFCEFTTIGEVATHVGESLAPLAAHYHLVVRAHPNFPEFGAMLQRFGIASTMSPTASLVPLADVFVAFASATIRWAIACGIPTVNYDVFHYGYGDFAAAKGVATVAGGSEFRSLVRTLVPGADPVRTLAANADEDREHWSVMDGGSLARIEDEIYQARTRRRNSAKETVKNA
jgi:hypothetical protein